MKKLITLLALCLPFFLISQDGGDDPTLMQIINIKVKPGHGAEFHAGMKAHNEKYHTEGMDAVNVYRIMSGPRSLQLLWIKGPMNWGSMDNARSEDHIADWETNIIPHADMGEFEFWRMSTSLYFMPEGFTPKVFQTRYIDIKPGKGSEFRELMAGIVKVYEKNNINQTIQIFYNQADIGTKRGVAMIWGYDSWSAMDTGTNMPKLYEEMHGEGSWVKFLEQLGEARDNTGRELFTLVPGLSVFGDN